jgi:hypothetical protein
MMHVEIEPTNQCNTRCLHCPHELITRPSGKMTWETFKLIFEKIDTWKVTQALDLSIEFAGMGEPLLNPLVYRFIRTASTSARISLTTNASALTPVNIQKLEDAGLHQLTISYNGHDAAVYELMMGGLNFEHARQHISDALAAKQDSQMALAANVSVAAPTEPQLEQIRNFLIDVGFDTVYFSKCHNRGGFLKDGTICTTPQSPVESRRCDIFTDTLFIAWSGEVLSCCHDLGGENIIGDLVTQDLPSILARKENIAVQGVHFRICETCSDMQRFMQDRTPDGRWLSEWVYDLYTPEQPEIQQDVSALSEWIFTLYEQQGQEPKLYRYLAARLQQRDRTISLLAQRLNALESSRGWRAMRRLQRLRLFIIPPASWREKWFYRWLNWLKIQ